VVQLNGINGEMFTNTLIPVGPNGVERSRARFDMRKFADGDVEAMLR